MEAPTTIGDYDATLAERIRQFELVFHTDHLRLTWTHSDLSANFISHYFANRLLAERGAAPSRDEIMHSINYMINELMENVIKFHSGGNAVLAGGVEDETVAFMVSNEISEEQVGPFTTLLEELTAGDPGDLLLQKIEQNAEDGGSGSGLGYLTLMNDYQAKLGWYFEPAGPQTRVTTMACLNL